MITNERILELAREHLEVLIADDDELNSPTDFAATREQLLRFANEIYNEGYEDGWESRVNVEYLNSSYPTGLVGEPQ
jgi:translation elongation factor EF-Ts